MNKLTLEQFLIYKQEIMDFFDKNQDIFYDMDFDNEEEYEQLVEKFMHEYMQLMTKLLNNDLSDIPFESWEEFPIISHAGIYTPDFSKTHANIDFSLVNIDGDGTFNFKSCNIANLESYDYRRRDDRMFDKDFVAANSELFPFVANSEKFKDIHFSTDRVTLQMLEDLSMDEIALLGKSVMFASRFDDRGISNLVRNVSITKVMECYLKNKEDFLKYATIYGNLNMFFIDMKNFYGSINKQLLLSAARNLENMDSRFKGKSSEFQQLISENFNLFIEIYATPMISNDIREMIIMFKKSGFIDDNVDIKEFFNKYLKLLVCLASSKNPNLTQYISENNNFNLINKYNSVEEFATYTNDIFVMDKNQSIILELFDPKLFVSFAKETGIFKTNFDQELEMVLNYFKDNSVAIPKTEEEFLQFMTDVISKEGLLYQEQDGLLREKQPSMFLPKDAPIDIKQKFYSRTLTIEEIKQNANLFTATDISFGLDKNYSWVRGLQERNKNLDVVINTVVKCNEITDKSLKNLFIEYVTKNMEQVTNEKLEDIVEVLIRLTNSNSLELSNFKLAIAKQIIDLDNPLEKLEQIEKIFLKNNLPTIGKTFLVFQILHPNCSGFDWDSDKLSPILTNSDDRKRNIIIFADLIKAAMGSNNRSIKEYLDNIEIGNKLYIALNNGEKTYDSLTEEEISILKIFAAHLTALYENSKLSNGNIINLSGDLSNDLTNLYSLFKPTSRHDLPDRIIRMFAGFANLKSFAEAKEYLEKTVEYAHKRNINTKTFTLEKGDVVKGINSINYLRGILQNGSVAKEFLGSYADSDLTPLDTDLSLIMKSGSSLDEVIEKSEAKDYGPIYFVLKNRDNRFTITRRNSDIDSEPIADKVDYSKLELFYTGAIGKTHYGIRTGFASSEIDYIIADQNDKRIGLEIVLNGFYIPVVDRYTQQVIFTIEDYEKLRKSLRGLSYYTSDEYDFAPEIEQAAALMSDEEKEEINKLNKLNMAQTEVKRRAIYNVISSVVTELGYELVYDRAPDLTPGKMEIIDTGSTGRGTNKPGDGDFDFMLKVDNSIMSSPVKLDELRKKLIARLPYTDAKDVSSDLKIKGVSIAGLDELVDIDITFAVRTDKISYSTDECVKDRLRTIKKQSEVKYNLIVNNIIMAKKVLKSYGVYSKGNYGEGGLGGVGVENWILQNGGSFERAARSFLEAAEGKDFKTFSEEYTIWDFGENHIAGKKGYYAHDNFVNNMNEDGYKKMCECLREYLKSLEETRSVEITMEDGAPSR